MELLRHIPKKELIKQTLKHPDIKKKMKEYVFLLSGQEGHSDPVKLCFQVHQIREGIKKEFLKKTAKNHLNKSSFDNYCSSDSFEKDLENFTAEHENAMGFDSFDNYDSYDTFAPIVAGIASKAIKAGGKAIAKKIAEKKSGAATKQKAAAVQEHAKEVSRAIDNGATPSDLVDVAKKVVGDQRLGQTKILKAINETKEQYIRDQKKEEIKKMIPQIMIAIVIVLAIGYFVGKKLS